MIKFLVQKIKTNKLYWIRVKYVQYLILINIKFFNFVSIKQNEYLRSYKVFLHTILVCTIFKFVYLHGQKAF
jgi:hypothetical protein